jgi:hypothetical protein
MPERQSCDLAQEKAHFWQQDGCCAVTPGIPVELIRFRNSSGGKMLFTEKYIPKERDNTRKLWIFYTMCAESPLAGLCD